MYKFVPSISDLCLYPTPHPTHPDVKSWLIGKDPDAGKDWSQKKKGAAEDEMVW